MLDSLRFVQGAVAKKDFVAELTHFHISNGTVRGYNGMMGLCCPIELDLDVCPKAVPFVKAIQTCKDTIAIHMTPGGRLSVKSGSFKAFVDCITESFPEVQPEGQEVEVKGGILDVLKTLNPFIAEDASRPWARGILLRGQSAFATNNVCVIEHWLGVPFPVEINIPKAAVVELIRIGQEPTKLQFAENSVTFHFPGNRWLRTQTFPTDWPDLGRILDAQGDAKPLPEGLFEAVHDLVPFVNELGQLFFNGNTVTTGKAEGEGASAEIVGLEASGCYNEKQFRLLEGVANLLDLNSYPKPSLFYGDRIRGAIVGMRQV